MFEIWKTNVQIRGKRKGSIVEAGNYRDRSKHITEANVSQFNVVLNYENVYQIILQNVAYVYSAFMHYICN